MVLVVGCSTSEIVGGKIGTCGSEEAAQAVFASIYAASKKHGLYLAFQCCEHLNRALVTERETMEKFGWEEVTVRPMPHAGGSMATAAYDNFTDPVVVESIKAHLGIDIGQTLIGMHLKRVAVPVRLAQKTIGAAIVTAAREIAAAIGEELGRQRNKIELIASENFVSPAVMEAMGSVLTGHRYYGGCEYVDKVETLAIERAKKLFGAEHANVQAHSGANANTAVYFAFLQPGDTIMGMNLSQGGHLSHGSPVNISGKYYNVVPYGVTHETERIDYDEFARIAKEAQPKLIVAGARCKRLSARN